ncbi:hypothetical protein BRSU_0875 [Brachyspira suanatina]|uniref:Uncharacterized protein n=1 Tax=Brachyspira suanatina TaxID=381802 RepID=A0A0G4K5K8_9SPIR|nr:hypothetical protein [Brachyspira suanatina]CRF32566.1 hypothetical protein BRSU_0875 [Brachyspira suanatina]
MKNFLTTTLIAFIIILTSNIKAYSQEIGNFYFLYGNENNDKAIMYLSIFEDDEVSGSYYTSNNESFDFTGKMKGNELDIQLKDKDYNDVGTIKGTLSHDLKFEGNRNSKKIKLSLANTKINKARIYKTDTYIYGPSLLFKFDSNVLNKAMGEYNYYGFYNITYLDDKIIIFEIIGAGERSAGLGFIAFSINDGKKIDIEDFLNIKDPNLISKCKYFYENGVNFYDLSYCCSFNITPHGKITLLYDPGTTIIYDDAFEGGSSYVTPGKITQEYTLGELKTYIKKNSVLDYLFN